MSETQSANLLILNSVAERFANRTGRTGLPSGADKRPLFCISLEINYNLLCQNIHLLYCLKASLFFPFWNNKFPCSFPWKRCSRFIKYFKYFEQDDISPFWPLPHPSHSPPNEGAPSASRICRDFDKRGQPADTDMKSQA